MCMTIPAAFELFEEDNKRKMLSAETIKDYNGNIARFVAWLAELKITKTRHIDDEVVDDYKLFLSETVGNKTTVNTYLRHVRRFLYFLMEKNEIKPFKITLLKDTYKIKPTFDSDEVERIIASVDAKDDTSVIMLLLLATGMRSRTLCELQVRDIHFSDGYIDLKSTKSGIPLCPPLSAEVLKCLEDYISYHNLNKNNLMFCSIHGNKFNRNSLWIRFKKRLAELKINKTGVHIFRHTFGKMMSYNGCPTATLQKWFGHADIKTTEKYTNLYGRELLNTVDMTPSSAFKNQENYF